MYLFNNYNLISSSGFAHNIVEFIQSLTLIDVVFFFAVLLLMVLIVVLIYFIKINEDVLATCKEENNISKPSSYSDEEGELLDLASITKALEEKQNNNIDLTSFEEDQERNAIISYDELLAKAKYGDINYKSESYIDDLSVKEVDLDNLINESTSSKITNEIEKPVVISYQQEEAFLDALKRLQKQIN